MCNKTPESEKTDSGVSHGNAYPICHCEAAGRGNLAELF